MARLRIGGITTAQAPRLRIGGLLAHGTATAPARLRIGGVLAHGTVAVTLSALPDIACEPLSTQTVTASPALGAPTPDAYTWRVISGTLTLTGSGATRTFDAPYGEPGATARIGVKGTYSGVDSPEVQFNVTTPPHQYWLAEGTALYPPVAL
jgi:hypothetical protein